MTTGVYKRKAWMIEKRKQFFLTAHGKKLKNTLRRKALAWWKSEKGISRKTKMVTSWNKNISWENQFGKKEADKRKKIWSKRALGNKFSLGKRWHKTPEQILNSKIARLNVIDIIKKNNKNNPNYGMRNKKHSEKTKKLQKKRAIEYANKIGCFKIFPKIGKSEKEILDRLQNHLKLEIKRQVFVKKYYLDGYCKQLNLAIEVDEPSHFRNRAKIKKDKKREDQIKEILRCNFLRIPQEQYLANLNSENKFEKRYPFIFEHQLQRRILKP